MASPAYDQQFLYHIATKNNMGLLDAVLAMDECIKITAAKHNFTYVEVYNTIFTKECLAQYLKTEKACNQLTLDECENDCNCFIFNGECLPRLIPNYEKINDDPDKYIKTHLGNTKDLKRLTEIAAYLYYNYDGGGLTDNSFDALEYHLKKREKIKGRAYEKIGAPPVEKIRTHLLYPMPSLAKVKPGTSALTKFLLNFDDRGKVQCCWSLKLDGTSGMVIYENGKITNINTRGNGIIGGDVTYLKDYIKSIPNNLATRTFVDGIFVVRGEFVISKDNWEKKYKGSYANARSFVNSKINSGFISTALHDIDFVTYQIMVNGNEATVPQPSQAFKILAAEGFLVDENGLLTAPTVFAIMELYKRKRTEALYYIDGLSLSVDVVQKSTLSIAEGGVLLNPTHTVAFKMQLEEQVRSTKVIDVEWNISRYGRYVPVAIYEAVYIDGIRLTRATAHDARHVVDWSMGKGTKVKIVRSGDVIPQIKDVDSSDNIVPILPLTYEFGGYEWHWEGSNIILNEIETNREVLIKRIVYFFETIGVPKLRQKTAEKMYDADMKTPESIVSARVSELIKIKNIGKKTAEFFYNTIRETMSKTPPDRFIVASTTFDSGVGRKLLKQLFREIPNILDLSEDRIRDYFKSHKLPGFGPSRIETIATGIPKFRKYLDSFAKDDVERAINFYINKLKDIASVGYNKMISGRKFVLTGFLKKERKKERKKEQITDFELEDYIYENNGDYSSTVTSDVAAVICGDVINISKKMLAASELKIPVLSIREFSQQFGFPLKRFETEDKNESDEED